MCLTASDTSLVALGSFVAYMPIAVRKSNEKGVNSTHDVHIKPLRGLVNASGQVEAGLLPSRFPVE